MRCPICKTSVKHLIKEIEGKSVYQCGSCQLAVFQKNKRKKPGKELYLFKEYKKQEKRFDRRLKKLAKIVVNHVHEGRLLDVGAGFGQFSSILGKLGEFEINLVEPSVRPKYLIKKNFFAYKKTYERFLAFHPTGGKYDLILMMDVIEHFEDPSTSLKETKKILKKDGYLVIQTPNYRSLMARICRNWSWWMPQDHKYVFSPRSIKKILEKTGYEIVFFFTYEDFYDFRKNLDGNFETVRKKPFRKLFKAVFFALFIPIYVLFRPVLHGLGYGGLVFLVAKKYNKTNEK